MKPLPFIVLAVCLTTSGCDTLDRVNRLEKENQELKAARSKADVAVESDLQAKCSKDAKAWFNENWANPKDTILLDYTNHYNKSSNKCFISIEWHYRLDKNGSWVNDLMLWDVYENSKYGNLSENHMVYLESTIRTETSMGACEVYGKKCKTVDEYNQLVWPFMNN